jgi:hypothetical protein
MSDHWEMFPCQMGEHAAFITYDHGIRDALATLPFPNCLRVRIDLQHANENGLPTGDEFAALNAIEEGFEAGVPSESGVYVGRITTNGRRFLMYYVALDEAEVIAIRDRVAESTGYAIGTSLVADPERDGYWQELFPTADDWQVIKDMRVESALRERGDPLTVERPIDHWAMFPSAAARAEFVAGLGGGFIVVDTRDDDSAADDSFIVQLQAPSLPDHRSMMQSTLVLRRAAEHHGGRYDGWECPVCINDDRPESARS